MARNNVAKAYSERTQKVYDFVLANPNCEAKNITIDNYRSLSDIYRQLYLLCEMGLVKKVTGKGPMKFIVNEEYIIPTITEPTQMEDTKNRARRYDIKDEDVISFVKNNEGCTVNEFAVMHSLSNAGSWHRLQKFVDSGDLEKKSTTNENGKAEYKYYTIKHEDIIAATDTARTPKEPKPRELMKQLKEMGYTGILKYSKEKTVDFQKLTVEQFQKYQEQGYEATFTLKRNYEINLNKID